MNNKTDGRIFMSYRRSIGALLVATMIPVASGAVTDQDLAQIRESIKQLEQRHAEDQARISDLERRLKETESKLRETGKAAPAPPPATVAAQPPAKPEPPPATKALTPVASAGGNITFTPGFRLQGRYSYDTSGNDDKSGDDHDFFIKRFRLKAKGEAFDLAQYYAEIKIDGVGQGRGSDPLRAEPDPSAKVESAWLNFPVHPDLAFLVGQYDLPFSRNALTSDSKLLLMDRSQIKEALTALGLADNTIGVMAHGRPFGGHFGYSVGVFDNIGSQNSGAKILPHDVGMPAGRFEFDFLDPSPPGGYADYKGSYIGQGQRLSLGLNAAYLPNAREASNGVDLFGEYDLYAWGGDLFFNMGPFVFEAEYDRFNKNMENGFFNKQANPDREGDGWYVQAGYLLHSLFEPVVRYQELDPDDNVSNDKIRWASVGFNTYLRDHNLKIQTDYTFKMEQEGKKIANDLFQVQLQLDY